jgi:hypothetical protein
MFNTLYRCPRTIARHENSPLAESRRRYLEHLAAQGAALHTIRAAAGAIYRATVLLGSVTKGRVTEVVRQTGGFDRVRIDAADDFASLCILSQFLGQRTTNLRYLEGMREAIVENVRRRRAMRPA